MEYLIGFIVIVGIAVVITVINERKEKAKRREKLRSSFGAVPSNRMSLERFASLGAYLNSLPTEATDIDEITWNDLDMDQVFHRINATCSAIGEEYLYAELHRPRTDAEELTRREHLIAYVTEHPEERLQLQMAFSAMGKMRNISVYGYMMRLSGVREEKNLKHYLSWIGYAIGTAVAFFPNSFGFGIGIVCLVALWNIIRYYKRKGEIEPFLHVVSFLVRWLTQVTSAADSVKDTKSVLGKELADMKVRTERFRGLIRGSRMLTPTNPTGSFSEMFLDYFRMLFHIDLIKFNQIYRIFTERREELVHLFEATGRLDAMIAVASFRSGYEQWCVPELGEDLQSLHTEAMYHPLVESPVPNGIDATRPVLLTGSNASGKSTFLKTVAINAILAQTVHTVLAKRYRGGYYRILSSMALRDDIAAKESYYIVEIRSLKRILDAAQGKVPVLCFVDEVLRGTNTAERIAASSRILRHLAEAGVICFAATHDIELTTMLGDVFDNYHFSEQVTEEGVTFDYCLKEGKATSRNAIRLLQMLGYPQEIVRDSMAAVEHFLATGDWNYEG